MAKRKRGKSPLHCAKACLKIYKNTSSKVTTILTSRGGKRERKKERKVFGGKCGFGAGGEKEGERYKVGGGREGEE